VRKCCTINRRIAIDYCPDLGAGELSWTLCENFVQGDIWKHKKWLWVVRISVAAVMAAYGFALTESDLEEPCRSWLASEGGLTANPSLAEIPIQM
jgi:hypothetical protein